MVKYVKNASTMYTTDTEVTYDGSSRYGVCGQRLCDYLVLLTNGGIRLMSAMLGRYIRRAEASPSLSTEQLRNESNAYNNIRSHIMAWDSLAKDSRNKNDWNNFAKYVLKEIQEMASTIKEAEQEVKE